MEHYQTDYVYEVMRSYAAMRGDSLDLGRNFLHVNYFNTSVNFINVSTAERVDEKIFSFLRGNDAQSKW